jgi:hypothetical protein
MLFAASFGEAVSNPDPWQMILGAVIPFVMVWLSGRFPMLATILKALGVNLNPSPAPGPAVDPVPPPVLPDNQGPLADLIRLLLDALKRKQAKAVEELADKLTKALDEK